MRIIVVIFSVLLPGCGGAIRGFSRAATGALPDDFGNYLVVHFGIRLFASVQTEYWLYICLTLVAGLVVFIYRRYPTRL